MAAKYQAYLDTYTQLVALKVPPPDIPGQTVEFKDDGTVTINFSSNQPPDIQMLRDYLTSLIG